MRASTHAGRTSTEVHVECSAKLSRAARRVCLVRSAGAGLGSGGPWCAVVRVGGRRWCVVGDGAWWWCVLVRGAQWCVLVDGGDAWRGAWRGARLRSLQRLEHDVQRVLMAVDNQQERRDCRRTGAQQNA